MCFRGLLEFSLLITQCLTHLLPILPFSHFFRYLDIIPAHQSIFLCAPLFRSHFPILSATCAAPALFLFSFFRILFFNHRSMMHVSVNRRRAGGYMPDVPPRPAGI